MKKQKYLTINYAGYEKCTPGHTFGPAIRSHYLIHFVLKGKGTYTVKDTVYRLKQGDAFLIQPQEVTTYAADSVHPWEYAWIAFDGTSAEYFLEELGLTSNRLTGKTKKPKELEQYLFALIDAQYNSDGYSILGYFFLILSTIIKPPNFPFTSYDKTYYEKASSYIRHNYSYDIHIQEVAQYTGIDRTYLYKIFKRYGQVSPKQFLIDIRLQSAQDLLQNTTYRITEIALSCGFHDSSSFCKHFQKKFSMTPGQYRIENM